MSNIYDEAMRKYYSQHPESDITPEEFFIREAVKNSPGGLIVPKHLVETLMRELPDARRKQLKVIKGGKWQPGLFTQKKS